MNRACNECGASPIAAHGLCNKHYQRAYRAGAFSGATCSLDCNAPLYAKGMCNVHYQRERKYGDPHHVVCIQGDNEARFWSLVVKTDGCWTWQGAPDAHGYGRLRIGDRQTKAHRFAYELLVGAIPDGLTIDHLCCNRVCVNPAHLEPVTASENVKRAYARRGTGA